MIATRSSFLSLLALAAACGGGGVASGGAGGAAPAMPATHRAAYHAGGPWRYLYERADTIVSVLPNGGRQQLVLERKLHLALQVTAAGSGFTVAVTIDSARVHGVPGGARSMEDSARGSVINGALAADGTLSALSASSDNGIAHALLAELPWLLPALPGRDSARTDTLDANVRFNVVDVAERTIRWTTPGSAFQMQGSVSREGVSPQLKLSGSGVRSGSVLLGGDGKLGQGVGRDSVSMTATVLAIGQSIEIIQLGAYSLTPIP